MLIRSCFLLASLAVGTWSALLPKRQDPGDCACITQLDGDGSPQQHTYQRQISNTVSNCGSIHCETGKSQGYTFTWGIGIDLEGPGDADFISGGFSVEKSHESGTYEGCTTEHPAKNVCLWYAQGYTSYNVRDMCAGESCETEYQNYRTIYAPNKNNYGGIGYYCVQDTCRSIGQGYWKSGRKGAPPS